MTLSNQNIIHRSAFNFEYGNQASASRCNSLIEAIFNAQILPELEKAISRHIPEGLHIELSKLEINIGQINEKEIPAFLAGRIGTALENALQNKINIGSAAGEVRTDLEKSSHHFLQQLLEIFLQKGYFPFGIDSSFSPDYLITKIIRHNKTGFQGILKKYRNYDTAINRLVLNVNSTTLDLVLQTLEPANYKWIGDYRKMMLKAKKSGNIQQFSDTEFNRTLDFLIIKYLLIKPSSNFIDRNFSNYLLEELKPFAGDNYHFFIHAAEQFDTALSATANINEKKPASDKENPEIDSEIKEMDWTVENLMELLNSEDAVSKKSNRQILRETILIALQNKQKRAVLLERLNKKGATFLIGLFYGENATQLISLIESFAGKVVKAGNLKNANNQPVKTISLVNHLVLHSVSYLAESSFRKLTNDEFVLFLMYSAGLDLTKTINSEDFRRFVNAENNLSIENLRVLIQDEKQFPEISNIQKSLAEQKLSTLTKPLNPDIRLTEEFITASKRKIISFYLDKGILPEGYNNLSWQDVQTLVGDLLRQKNNFLVFQFQKNEGDENLITRLNSLISEQVLTDLEAYFIHFFKKEYAILTHFLTQTEKLFTGKKPKPLVNQKYTVELFINALARSKGGAIANVFKLSVIENLFLELDQDLANPAGFIEFIQKQSENFEEPDTLQNNLNPEGEFKKVLERDFNQIIKAIYSAEFGEQAASQKIKRLIKSLGFYFQTNRTAFLEVLQKNEKDFLRIFALLKSYLPKKLWKQISESALSVPALKQKVELFKRHTAVILKEMVPSESKSEIHFKEAGLEKANVFFNLTLVNEVLFEQFVSTTFNSGIPVILSFEDNKTQTIFNRLFHFTPGSLSGKTEVKFWKSLVIRYAILTFLKNKKLHSVAFGKKFLLFFIQKLKSIQKTELFYPIVEEMKLSGPKELQEIAMIWQNPQTTETVEKTTTTPEKESAYEKIRACFSFLKFYAENGFFPWWAGNLTFPEIISGINEIRLTSAETFEYLVKQMENESIFELLLEKVPDSIALEFDKIFSGQPTFSDISKKRKKEKTTGEWKKQQETEHFQQEIYFLTDMEILNRWKTRDPKIAIQISEYVSLSPYFYFRNINPAQWRKTVYEFSNDFYKSKDERFTDSFHADFLKHLKQKYPTINWGEAFTKVYLLVKKSKSGEEVAFPDTMLQLLNISQKNLSMTTNENFIPASEEGLQVRVLNAGLILFWPFLTRLFEIHSFVENGNFVDPDSRNRAVYILQQLVYSEINFPEYELALNKLLVGMPADEHLVPIVELNRDEIESAKSLLNGLINNWENVQNSTPEGIQETFLQREGILKFDTDKVTLVVEKKGVDLLMQSIPWNISLIKLPWMRLPIFVEWI